MINHLFQKKGKQRESEYPRYECKTGDISLSRSLWVHGVPSNHVSRNPKPLTREVVLPGSRKGPELWERE